MYDIQLGTKAQNHVEASLSVLIGQGTVEAQELQLLQLLELLQLRMEPSRSQDGWVAAPAHQLSFPSTIMDGLPPASAGPMQAPQSLDDGAGDPIQRAREFLMNTGINPDTLTPPQLRTFSEMMPTIKAEGHTPST